MEPPSPILVAGLFPGLRQHLLSLIDTLSPAEWLLPTAAERWNVKDIALHLLGGDIGILSRRRDMYTPPGVATSNWDDLVAQINRLNASWIDATRRLSTPLLSDL